MAQEVTNFSRFYALFSKLPCHGDREQMKRELVRNFTWGRTDSLRDMTKSEYADCCIALEKIVGVDEWRQKMKEEQRYRRSVCLKLMQKLGIDTTEWDRVNDFCRSTRIAGKPFRELSNDELTGLSTKLRVIHAKGGLKSSDTVQETNKSRTTSTCLITIKPTSNEQAN